MFFNPNSSLEKADDRKRYEIAASVKIRGQQRRICRDVLAPTQKDAIAVFTEHQEGTILQITAVQKPRQS